jgi:hypothetical protein
VSHLRAVIAGIAATPLALAALAGVASASPHQDKCSHLAVCAGDVVTVGDLDVGVNILDGSHHHR